jgi:ABC-type nitrate/sulfonate/bicarbonate transport system substrate-binding protein
MKTADRRAGRPRSFGLVPLLLLTATIGLLPVDARGKQPATLEMPFILWGGDVATFHANGGLETKPGTLFDKLGLKLKLTRGDDFDKQVDNYLTGKSPFLRGTMSMLGQASEKIAKADKNKPVVFLQLTWSKGDHLIARAELKTLDNLKGKTVALQKGGPHVGMLDDVLHTAGLQWSDIKVVWTLDVTGDKGPPGVFRNDAKVDACFAITPDMIGLTGGLDSKGTGVAGTVPGAHVLVSTATMQRSIADVYACRKDFYDANKELIEKFTAGYLRACEELVDLRKKHHAKDKEATARYKALLKLTQDIYGRDDVPGEADADALIDDAVFVGLPGNYSFFVDKGNLSGFEAKQKGALDLALKLKDASARFEFLHPQFDYDKLKRLGELTSNKNDQASTFKKDAVPPPLTADDALFTFSIRFAADQSTFPVEDYGVDFQRVVEQASLFGKGLVVVRGHSDIAAVLKEFVTKAVASGMLKKEGKSPNLAYFLKDGKEVSLKDTRKVLELVEELAAMDDGPKAVVKEMLDLSNKRATEVRDAIIKYAAGKGYKLDAGQIRAEGVGVTSPVVPYPRNLDDAAKNRIVEIRLMKSKGKEQMTQPDFDF